MNRTKGFVNLNRFKSGRTLKRLNSIPSKYRVKGQKRVKK